MWWHDAIAGQHSNCEPEWVGAEHPLFILYTSGSTGKPKGVLLTHRNVLSGVANAYQAQSFDFGESVLAYLPMAWVGDHLSHCASQHFENGLHAVLTYKFDAKRRNRHASTIGRFNF